MLDQHKAGGATELIRYDSWLASVPALAATSGPKNRSLFGYRDDWGIAEPIKEQEDDSLEWAAEKFSTLLREFQGQWILIKDHRVIANAIEPMDLLRRAIAMGIKKPFMLHVEPSSAAQRDAFAAC